MCPAALCSGHGVCSGAPSYICTCYDGFGGADCSQLTCPMGIAWWDEPWSNNNAHRPAVCSNMVRFFFVCLPAQSTRLQRDVAFAAVRPCRVCATL